MPLRNSVIAEVWASIDNSPFSPADFQVVTDGRDSLLKIIFRYNSAYKFIFNKFGVDGYIVTVSPGRHETEERIQLDSPSKIADQVLARTKNIRDELRATIPVYSELDSLRETVEKHVREHVDHPEQPFSQEEAGELRVKLDDLMAKFQEMQERHELTEKEVNRLNQEIDSIKTNLSGYPKGTWYKTAANKIWTAVSKVGTSKESRQVLAKAAQNLLGLDEGL